MAKKTEKTDDFAPNPLVESGVEKMIRVVRGKQVLLDRDLAALYGVETKRINEQVKRNIERFPKDFCFQLDATEHKFLRSQIATTKTETRGGRQYFPYAFTEQGVAMLSSVLKSETAIKVNIAIMRAFVQLRHLMMGNGGLINRLSNVEAKNLEQDSRLTGHDEHLLDHDRKFDELFEAMDRGELKSKGLYYNNQEFDAYDHDAQAGKFLDSPMQVLPSYGMHNRFLFIDDTAYHFGASLKDLGKNTFPRLFCL